VICNPPYGARIGERKLLFGLYASFGQVLKERFPGWRAAIITSDGGLAKATGLPFLPPSEPIAHGGLKVKLYQTAPLP
jgi:putative N6-adenine-specific DNA methylase